MEAGLRRDTAPSVRAAAQTTTAVATPTPAPRRPSRETSVSTEGSQGTVAVGEPGGQGTRQADKSRMNSGQSRRPSNTSRRENSDASLRRRPDSRSSKTSLQGDRPTSRACVVQ